MSQSSFIILHGEHTVASRQKLQELLHDFRSKNYQITRLEAKPLDVATLQEALGRNSLFGQEQVVVIEGLHSLPTSARKKELIESSAHASTPVILWEKRALTPTMIKKFAGAQAQEFKPTSHIFKWLDSLQGEVKPSFHNHELLAKAVSQDGAELCFHLLVRQIRLLLSVKVNHPVGGAPFMIAKYKKQATTFSLTQLLAFHEQLFIIEKKTKTGLATADLATMLDLLSLGLYSKNHT